MNNKLYTMISMTLYDGGNMSIFFTITPNHMNYVTFDNIK